MTDPTSTARARLKAWYESDDEVEGWELASSLGEVLDFISTLETRAIAGMIGMDPEQGAEKVREAVAYQLRARRRALDDLARVKLEHTSAYIVHDGKVLRCSEEVAEAFRALSNPTVGGSS